MYLYDYIHNVRKKAMLKLDADELVLYNRPARFSSISMKMDIKPISLYDVLECVPGSLLDQKTRKLVSEENLETLLTNQCFLTIVTHNAVTGSRNVVLLLENRDERNALLSNLR